MLASASAGLPADPANYAFEYKWDGVRAVAYIRPGRLRLESRNLREITDGYPEVRGLLRDLGMREAVLDGEPLPLSHRAMIKKYFELIRPQGSEMDKPADDAKKDAPAKPADGEKK